jgi:hypothetical protein
MAAGRRALGDLLPVTTGKKGWRARAHKPSLLMINLAVNYCPISGHQVDLGAMLRQLNNWLTN